MICDIINILKFIAFKKYDGRRVLRLVPFWVLPKSNRLWRYNTGLFRQARIIGTGVKATCNLSNCQRTSLGVEEIEISLSRGNQSIIKDRSSSSHYWRHIQNNERRFPGNPQFKQIFSQRDLPIFEEPSTLQSFDCIRI